MVYKFSNIPHYQPSKALKQKQWSKWNRKPSKSPTTTVKNHMTEIDFRLYEKYAKQLSVSKRHKCIGTLQIESDKIVSTALKHIIKHTFHDSINDKLPFDMTIYHGQCLFWWNVLDKLGVINEMVYSSYLRRCGHNQPLYLESDHFRFMSQNMIYSDHLFYILNEIEKKTDCMFNNNYLSSNKVIMNTNELIYVLDTNNNSQIGIDICGLIAEYTTTKTSNVLSFLNDYTTNKSKNLKTKKEYHSGHQIIDTYKYDSEFHFLNNFGFGKELIRKIYNGRDITESYFHVQTLLQKNEDNIAEFNQILCVLWHKIREVYTIDKALIKPNLIYRMLMYYVDNIELFDDSVTFRWSKWNYTDYKMWCDLYKNMKSQICKNILLLISNELGIADTQRQNFMNLVHKNLVKNMSANVGDLRSFSQVLSNSFYFKNMKPAYSGIRTTNGWFSGCGFSRYYQQYGFKFNPSHSSTQISVTCQCYDRVCKCGKYVQYYRHFWTNIWKQIQEKKKISENKNKFKILYKLMLDHANIYMNANVLKEFILHHIVPILLKITNKEADSVQINAAIQILDNNFVYKSSSFIDYLSKLNTKSLNLVWRFEDKECDMKEKTIMYDTQWKYGAQKYAKRENSKHKQERKKLIRQRNVTKNKQIIFEDKSMISNNKQKKELQRMKWIKYNNKKRGKNSNQLLKYIKYTISEANCVVSSV